MRATIHQGTTPVDISDIFKSYLHEEKLFVQRENRTFLQQTFSTTNTGAVLRRPDEFPKDPCPGYTELHG